MFENIFTPTMTTIRQKEDITHVPSTPTADGT